MRRREKWCVLGTVLAVLAGVGLTGTGTAGATGVTIDVTPKTGLSDGSSVQVSVSGATPSDLGRLYIAECGNAYANGTALPVTVDVDQDCTTIGWIDSPFNPQNFFVKQIGLGAGNRSCVASANRPCFMYGPSGINMPPLPTPQVNISFAHDPTGNGAQPSATTTTLTSVGSPVATGKAQHALVHVLDDAFRPDGTITVTEGATTVGTGTMLLGVADVVLSPGLSLGSHTIVAHYPGDGSFIGSSSPPTDFSVVGVNNVSIGDVSIVRGVGGTRTMMFPVVLSQLPTASFRVPYSIVPGTAVAGVDYIAPKPTAGVSFVANGATVKYITVKLLSDTNPTGTKTFTVHLGTPTGGVYVLRDADGTGTLYDPATGGATVNVGGISITEGDGGVANIAKFPVTLSVVPTKVTKVTLTIASGVFDTASKGPKGHGDYNSKYTVSVTFIPPPAPRVGPVTKTVSAQVWPDTTDELDETFTVTITGVLFDPAQPFSIGRSTGTGVILSDE